MAVVYVSNLKNIQIQFINGFINMLNIYTINTVCKYQHFYWNKSSNHLYFKNIEHFNV